MKLWIDDTRPAPEGYTWCKSTLNALYTIYHAAEDIVEINLDHDAGDYFKEGGDFIEILKELERLCHRPGAKGELWRSRCSYFTFVLHSANPVGVQNMRAIIQANGWIELL